MPITFYYAKIHGRNTTYFSLHDRKYIKHNDAALTFMSSETN